MQVSESGAAGSQQALSTHSKLKHTARTTEHVGPAALRSRTQTQGRKSCPIMAESTKELTDEGAKVTTTVEGSDATAAAPAEPGKKGYWPGAVWNSTGRVGTRGQI